MDLKGRVALITGAGRGIGATIAQTFARYGAKLVIADVNKANAERTAADIAAQGNETLGLHVDVSDPASVRAMVDATLARFGTVDILVNNAGIGNFKPLLETTVEDWDRVMDINLKGAFLCCQAVFPIMQKARYGKIINIASMGGQLGGLKVAPDYVSSKAGIVGLTKSYARHGAAHGILSNAVAPGPTESEMASGHFDPTTMPLGRLGRPEDVAWAVFFLASPMSDYITGATIDVNGGMLMR